MTLSHHAPKFDSGRSAKAMLNAEGYVRFDGVFSPEYMASLAMRAAGTLSRCPPQARDAVRSNGSMCNLASLPEYADLLAHPAILSTLRAVGAADIRWTGGYLISKPPQGPPLFWHQDWWGWDNEISYERSPAQLFVMVYLTPTGRDNGCLRVIPGSHLTRHRLHEVSEAHAAELAGYRDASAPAFASDPDEVAVAVSPGDVLVGDSRLLHGAYANKTEGERPLLTLWYTPDFANLPQPIQAHYARSMREQSGDIVGEQVDLSPFQWPAIAYETVRSLLPTYTGHAEPQAWNRRPNLSRLAQ